MLEQQLYIPRINYGIAGEGDVVEYVSSWLLVDMFETYSMIRSLYPAPRAAYARLFINHIPGRIQWYDKQKAWCGPCAYSGVTSSRCRPSLLPLGLVAEIMPAASLPLLPTTE